MAFRRVAVESRGGIRAFFGTNTLYRLLIGAPAKFIFACIQLGRGNMQFTTAEAAKRDIQLSLRVLSAIIRDEIPEPDAVRELMARCPELGDLPADQAACILIRQNVRVLHVSENKRAMAATAAARA